MMIKYRVSDVAKDFGVPGKAVIELLARFDETPKKSATALQEEELDLVFESGKAVEVYIDGFTVQEG